MSGHCGLESPPPLPKKSLRLFVNRVLKIHAASKTSVSRLGFAPIYFVSRLGSMAVSGLTVSVSSLYLHTFDTVLELIFPCLPKPDFIPADGTDMLE